MRFIELPDDDTGDYLAHLPALLASSPTLSEDIAAVARRAWRVIAEFKDEIGVSAALLLVLACIAVVWWASFAVPPVSPP